MIEFFQNWWQTISILSLTTVFIILMQICKVIQDKLQFHYHKSIFSDSKRENWWNPEKSWENKYIWANGKRWKEWLLSNPLVFITDAWHFFGMLRFLFVLLAILTVFYVDSLELWQILLYLALLWVKARATFHFFFHKFLNK